MHGRKGEAREGLKYKYVVGRADVGPRVGIKIPQLGIRYFSTNYIVLGRSLILCLEKLIFGIFFTLLSLPWTK